MTPKQWFEALNNDMDLVVEIKYDGGDFLEARGSKGNQVYPVIEGVVYIPGNPMKVDEVLSSFNRLGLEGGRMVIL